MQLTQVARAHRVDPLVMAAAHARKRLGVRARQHFLKRRKRARNLLGRSRQRGSAARGGRRLQLQHVLQPHLVRGAAQLQAGTRQRTGGRLGGWNGGRSERRAVEAPTRCV
eukprot:191217-Chlamydomonas_euryale.AAC.1